MSEDILHQHQFEAQPVFAREPDFDWFVQHADVIRPLPRPEGMFVRGYDDTEIFPPTDWNIQQADVIQLAHQVRPGFYAFVEPISFVFEIEPDFGWFVQETDVVRPRHQVRPEFYTLVEFSVPISLVLPIISVESGTDVIRVPDKVVGY